MKYLYLISIFLAFNLKNLSAYQEITIQKDSNLQNYQELLLRINNSITEEDIISLIEKNIYNINFRNLKLLWFKLLDKNKSSYQLSIDPSNYKKLKYFTGLEPKILSYEQNKLHLDFENIYDDKQINFLVNFF